MAGLRHMTRIFAALLALASVSCGGDFDFDPGKLSGNPAPVAAVYDVEAAWPGLEFPEFQATGLVLDLTLEFDPESPDPVDGSLRGTVTIHEARVGGLPRDYSPRKPFDFTGRLIGNQIGIRFGPVTVGMTTLSPDLDGIVRAKGRLMDGIARFLNFTETGSWFGIKQRRYLVASSGFGLQGTVSVITVRFDVRFQVDRDVELVSGDPVVAASRDTPLVVNRFFFDNYQILDPADDYLTAAQFSTGNGSNPHDAILVAPGRLYVSRYDAAFNDILVSDPNSGATLGTIPMGPLATNSTGTARPERFVEANGMILVTLQNVDTSFVEYGPGRVAFLDPSDDSVIADIDMEGTNPFGPPSVHPGTREIYVAAAGIFQGLLPQELSGGIEVIDPFTLSTRGLLVDDDDLGGNVSAVAVVSGKQAYAVVVTAAGTNRIVAFDPGDGTILGTVLNTPAFIPEIRYDGDGYLLVAVNDIGSPELLVLDAGTGAPVASLPLSLPPVSVAILTRGLQGGS